MRTRNMPSKQQINKYWERQFDEMEIGCDTVTNGKDCFACGSPVSVQRAHIAARCNGGSDDVENLHLLCSACHTESENLEGDKYWKWFDYRLSQDSWFTSFCRRTLATSTIDEIKARINI